MPLGLGCMAWLDTTTTASSLASTSKFILDVIYIPLVHKCLIPHRSNVDIFFFQSSCSTEVTTLGENMGTTRPPYCYSVIRRLCCLESPPFRKSKMPSPTVDIIKYGNKISDHSHS